MNTDSYYEIGHSHIACEDYALSGVTTKDLDGKRLVMSYAIVCDGCSASAHVDVGARVLAHAAKNFLCNEYINNLDAFKELNADEFCVPIIASAHGTMKSLGLDNMCLDSTLLMAISDGVQTRVFAYGDGFIVIKNRDGSIKTYRIEFTEGAPYYLSYALDHNRREAFFREFRQKCLLWGGSMVDDQYIEDSIPAYNNPEELKGLCFDFPNAEAVTLISDGVVSFEKIENGKVIEKTPMSRAITGMSKYKNLNGQFVERRMLKFRKECQKESIGHYDDISVASINLGAII